MTLSTIIGLVLLAAVIGAAVLRAVDNAYRRGQRDGRKIAQRRHAMFTRSFGS